MISLICCALTKVFSPIEKGKESLTMTEANKKEMLAGLFLSKFSEEGLRRLGYKTYRDAYRGLSKLVGGKPLAVRGYRDEFDPVFPNGRIGHSKREMRPSRKAMLNKYGGLNIEGMLQLLEEQFLGSQRYMRDLDAVVASTDNGDEVAAKSEATKILDGGRCFAGDIDPDAVEGRERISQAKARISQNQFRKWILSIYSGKCCVTGLAITPILRASHIVAWSEDKQNRMNPSNGLCLSATYDAAFDRHLISFDDDYRMILSSTLRDFCTNDVHRKYFLEFEGTRLALPCRFLPSRTLLERHRQYLEK